MPASIKNFAALASLRQELKAQDEARRAAEAERQRQQQAVHDEAELFRRSIGQVAPLTVAERATPAPARPSPVAHQHLADEKAALQESLSDEFTTETLLATDDELSFARDGIGTDTLRKLRRGHWVIQAQLDLHGLRRDEARTALAEFVRQASRRGLRCVRIIHGKGLGSVNREPVLKGWVRNWLPQKQEVLAFCQARAADGGSGALVVLLKASA
ncbi:MAG TPA: Smr/MutS family protein [Burkholderiaceae bacterium]|nr:Smr/MutS family protein [Burkholderiaceae bacterium]